MNIGIDIDDTISNTYESIFTHAQQYDIEVLGKQGEINNVGNCDNHFFWATVHNWSEKEIKDFLAIYYRKSLADIYPKSYAKEVIHELRKQGHKIYLVTARFGTEEVSTDEVIQYTRKWLDEYKIEYDELVVNAQNKLKVCEEKEIDIFIDDSFHNCERIAQSGRKVFLMDTKMNANLHADNVKRVYSWPYLKNQLNRITSKI